MYPKNSASPPTIRAKVISATDGAPITTGVSGYHVQGTTRGAVAGTAAAHIANGLWAYTPTQAETNYTSFGIEFYHADAVGDGPVVEVVTDDRPAFPTNFSALGIEADGDLTKVNELHGHTAQTGDSFARLGAPAGVSVSADVAAVKSDTGEILTDTGTTLDTLIRDIPTNAEFEARSILAASYATSAELAKVPKSDGTTSWNATALAAINAECDTALADYDAPTKAEMDSAFTEIKGTTWTGVTDTLEAIRDRGDAAWVTATGFATHSAADVWNVVARTLTANTNLNDPTAAAIAYAVWEETLADHLASGSTGNALNAAGSAGDPWSTALPGAYGAGTAGKIVGDNLNATVSSRSSHDAAAVATALGGTVTVTSHTFDAAPTVNFEKEQFAAWGTYTVDCTTPQTGDSHVMVFFHAHTKAVAWRYSTDGGEISVGGDTDSTLTITADDTHLQAAGTWQYALWNITDDICIMKGSLNVSEGAEPEGGE
jgi:hypothetical protein